MARITVAVCIRRLRKGPLSLARLNEDGDGIGNPVLMRVDLVTASWRPHRRTNCRVHKRIDVHCTGNTEDLAETCPLDRYVAYCVRCLIPSAEHMCLLCGSPKSSMGHDLHRNNRLLQRLDHRYSEMRMVP